MKGLQDVLGLGELEGVKTGHADKTQANHEHSRNGAALKGDSQRRINSSTGGLGGADIGPHIDIHADKSGRTGENRTNRKAHGSIQAKAGNDRDENKNHDPDDCNGSVLACQIGRCTGLDGRCDFLHPRITGRLGQNPTARNNTIHNSQKATN